MRHAHVRSFVPEQLDKQPACICFPAWPRPPLGNWTRIFRVFDGEQSSSFCLGGNTTALSAHESDSLNQCRSSEMEPATTHMDRNTHSDSHGWICVEHAQLIVAEHAHRSNFIHKAESTSTHCEVETPLPCPCHVCSPERGHVTPVWPCCGYRGGF